MNHFKGKQFQQDVIIVAVGYYLRYNLSYREVQELLYDRGINVCHTTIYRWVQEYSKILYHLWKKKNKQSFYSWKSVKDHLSYVASRREEYSKHNIARYLKKAIEQYLPTVKRQDLNHE